MTFLEVKSGTIAWLHLDMVWAYINAGLTRRRLAVAKELAVVG